jgi:hypothetical protein
MTTEEIDRFIGQRVKVTLLDGTVREGELKPSNEGASVFVKGFGYNVLRNVISSIEPLP